VITNDLDNGTPVVSFTASFKVLIGGGARFGYGDGMSFDFASDVPLASDPLAEQGVGSGLRVGMRTTKDATAANPAISVSAAGASVLGSPAYVDNLRANTWVDMLVQLNPDYTISVLYDGVYVYSNASVGWVPPPSSLFWIGARTGGATERHWIDNLNIVTRTVAAPFINSFAPRGRRVTANSSIDVVLTDYSTTVSPDSIVLKLDGTTVARTVTQDGSGHTTVHFAPASPFAPSSQHAVSVSFTDSAATPETQTFYWEFTVGEALPTGFVTVFSENFEGYKVGYLDKNITGDPNYAPNGSGNPWFGPWPENYSMVNSNTLTVDGTSVTIMPHSGTNMMTRAYLGPSIWVDLAYRFHNGQPIKGNAKLDWWFFDANEQVNNTNKDYVSLYYYASDLQPYPPFTNDWPAYMDPGSGLFIDAYSIPPNYPPVGLYGFSWADDEYQSLSLGGSGYNQAGGYWTDAKYQVRLEEMFSGVTYGIDGWINTIDRSQGWHHGCILMGPPHADGTVMVYFYIDDMDHPVYSGLSGIAAHGITLVEVDTGASRTPKPGAYDDFSFALVRPPNLTATHGPGHQTTLTWPGEGFTLQSAASLNGPWSDVPGASSGYAYDTTSAAMQFFRLRN